MYKMISGSVAELEAKLNDAEAEGFTVVVREFSHFHTPHPAKVEELEPRVTYSYLLSKPSRSPLAAIVEGMGAELLQMIFDGVLSGLDKVKSEIKLETEEEEATSTPAAQPS